MGNPFVHVELNTTDVRRAKAFYGKLFDWELEDHSLPVGTYTMVSVGKGTGGGMLKQLMPHASSAWIPYVLVDDLAAATEKARRLGAEIMKANEEVPDMGRFTILSDPTDAVIALWEPKKNPSAARPKTTARRRSGQRRRAKRR